MRDGLERGEFVDGDLIAGGLRGWVPRGTSGRIAPRMGARGASDTVAHEVPFQMSQRAPLVATSPYPTYAFSSGTLPAIFFSKSSSMSSRSDGATSFSPWNEVRRVFS